MRLTSPAGFQNGRLFSLPSKLCKQIFRLICIFITNWLYLQHENDTSEQYVRTVYKTVEFEQFYNSLQPKVQTKFDYVINVMSTVYNVSTKFVKHLVSSDLYEMRVSVGTNEYRTVLFAIDNVNFIEAKNIILLNAFLKKDNKDYRKQIDKAISILNYLEL